MSVRLEVGYAIAATPERVWSELVDWPGQARWIPLTQVRVTGARSEGTGVRVEALSGIRVGGVPVGLLDRFVVTGWTPPGPEGAGELAVLHLGPYFTGEGSFSLAPDPVGTRMVCTELFSLPGGAVPEGLARAALPALRRGFALSLRRLAAVAQASPRVN